MRNVLYTFKHVGGLRAMFEICKSMLGVPAGFKSGKHSNVGKPGHAGAKLERKAARGKLAGVGRGF